MKTILLEGTELSGKTTLAKSVRQKLTNEGFNIVINSGPINKTSNLVNTPLNIAKKIHSPSLKELLYTLSLITDRVPKEMYLEVDFFMQERYFPSVIAYSRVFNSFGINRYVGDYLQRLYPSFDINILVKTSLETRLERIKTRNIKTKLDEIIEEKPQIASDLEREIQRVLCKKRNYFELNTDEMNIDEATEEIYRRLIWIS